MSHQLNRIIKWKSENRTISDRMIALKEKMESSNVFDPKIIKLFEELAIKKGRNIARLQRMRTKISETKSNHAGFKVTITRITYCVDLTQEQFDKLNCLTVVPKLQELGAFDIEYNGRYGNKIFFETYKDKNVPKILAAIKSLVSGE